MEKVPQNWETGESRNYRNQKEKKENLFNNSVSILSAGDIEEDKDEEPVSQDHSMIAHGEDKMYT